MARRSRIPVDASVSIFFQPVSHSAVSRSAHRIYRHCLSSFNSCKRSSSCRFSIFQQLLHIVPQQLQQLQQLIQIIPQQLQHPQPFGQSIQSPFALGYLPQTFARRTPAM